EQQGARYEAALSRLAVAQTELDRGGDAAAVELARAEVRSLEPMATPTAVSDNAAHSVSVLDRFTTLLSAGRTIAAAPTPAAVEHAVREAALALLRGERCHVVGRAELDDDHLVSQSGESVDAVSRTLLRRAVEAGQPVVASDPTADESESLLLSGIRSVLAAPVVVHGQTVSCFYVTHRQVGQLFGDEEVQLAAFVAMLAGAAFEHLEGTETRFRSLAQNSSDVVTLVDRYGVVSYQSAAAGRVFALPSPGLVGRPVTEWVHPDDLTRFSEALERSAQSDGVRVECRFRHADGTFRHAETALTNLLADPTVGALVLNTRDVTERRRLEDELRERALHDTLTGLPNRALFLDRAQQALDRPLRGPLVVCFLDLDDFKAVNDTLGHGAGDELLCTVAERLTTCLRPEDTVARFGGDEFAVLLEDTDLQTAVTVVERILAVTAEPISLGGTDVVVHTSIGLAPVDTAASTTPDRLLAQSDAAMYAAKARGRHCYEVFAPQMRQAAEVRARVRSEIDRGLTQSEFLLHYQPIVEITTGQHRGAEALVRWEHPERGLLSPLDFIDHAEDSGQILALGRWVFDTACRDAGLLPAQAHMSVNVSGRQLQQPDLVGLLSDALEAAGLAPHRLVLEITETAAVRDIETAITRLGQLKDLGLQLALDDFGTGYSPLSHLRRFPVDYLKIDRSFVHGLARSEEDRAIVRGVIDMAHALGLQAVAEGVEHDDQHAILAELGCDLGQGYLWQEPGPVSALLPWSPPQPRRARGQAEGTRSTHVVPARE
ncbi:MAG: EAL domain-containing protein, partial [Mycobacteriales bacterium]